MREISEVMDRMLKLIPETEKDLISQLNYWKKHSMYQPPEVMGETWGHVALVLEGEFGKDPYSLEKGGWQQLITKEFMGSHYQPPSSI